MKMQGVTLSTFSWNVVEGNVSKQLVTSSYKTAVGMLFLSWLQDYKHPFPDQRDYKGAKKLTPCNEQLVISLLTDIIAMNREYCWLSIELYQQCRQLANEGGVGRGIPFFINV